MKRDQVPILRSKGTLPAFEKGFKDHCLLRFGEVGQNIIKNKLFETIPVEEKPHYNSLRIHPTTGRPLEGQRLYQKEPTEPDPSLSQPSSASKVSFRAQKAKSYASEEEKQIEEDSIPLTALSQAKLDRDTFNYDKRKDVAKAEQKIKKADDDACAAFMCDHISPEMFSEIEISILFSKWKELPHESADRAVLFMRLIKELLSSGNATDAVEAMSQLFSIKHSSDQVNPSSFLNALNEAFDATMPLIQDKDHPGMINGQQLKTILIITGLHKGFSANKAGIKDHLYDHKVDALKNPNELIDAVLKAHMSDINDERVSEQGSALAASVTPAKPHAKKTAVKEWTYHKNKPDKSQIPGKVHCANCLALTKQYFYSHPPDECNRTAESEKARKEKNAKLHAKVAAVEDPTPSPASAPAPTMKELVQEGVRAYMAQAGWSLEEDA